MRWVDKEGSFPQMFRAEHLCKNHGCGHPIPVAHSRRNDADVPSETLGLSLFIVMQIALVFRAEHLWETMGGLGQRYCSPCSAGNTRAYCGNAVPFWLGEPASAMQCRAAPTFGAPTPPQGVPKRLIHYSE